MAALPAEPQAHSLTRKLNVFPVSTVTTSLDISWDVSTVLLLQSPLYQGGRRPEASVDRWADCSSEELATRPKLPVGKRSVAVGT